MRLTIKILQRHIRFHYSLTPCPWELASVLGIIRKIEGSGSLDSHPY